MTCYPRHWGVQWREKNRLDGVVRQFMWGRCGEQNHPILFGTRQQARDYIQKRYGYIKERPDLRAEPHGWRMPRAVRVRVVLEPITGEAEAAPGARVLDGRPRAQGDAMAEPLDLKAIKEYCEHSPLKEVAALQARLREYEVALLLITAADSLLKAHDVARRALKPVSTKDLRRKYGVKGESE